MASFQDGTIVHAAESDLDREWIAGEASMADEAVRIAHRLVHLRRQRTGLNYDNAMRAACAEHRLKYWTVENMRRKGTVSVSAYTLKSLRTALIAEMEAAKAKLQEIIGSEREAQALAARIAAKRAGRI